MRGGLTRASASKPTTKVFAKEILITLLLQDFRQAVGMNTRGWATPTVSAGKRVERRLTARRIHRVENKTALIIAIHGRMKALRVVIPGERQ
jgi:hypothetical protein